MEAALGSFGCGMFKALVKQKIRIDIVGTSIGAVNAAIIADSKSDQPEKDLEDFWLEVKVICKLFRIYGCMNGNPTIKKIWSKIYCQLM
jgi:predicted acylesterase/phospholipase RssA